MCVCVSSGALASSKMAVFNNNNNSSLSLLMSTGGGEERSVLKCFGVSYGELKQRRHKVTIMKVVWCVYALNALVSICIAFATQRIFMHNRHKTVIKRRQWKAVSGLCVIVCFAMTVHALLNCLAYMVRGLHVHGVYDDTAAVPLRMVVNVLDALTGSLCVCGMVLLFIWRHYSMCLDANSTPMHEWNAKHAKHSTQRCFVKYFVFAVREHRVISYMFVLFYVCLVVTWNICWTVSNLKPKASQRSETQVQVQNVSTSVCVSVVLLTLIVLIPCYWYHTPTIHMEVYIRREMRCYGLWYVCVAVCAVLVFLCVNAAHSHSSPFFCSYALWFIIENQVMIPWALGFCPLLISLYYARCALRRIHTVHTLTMIQRQAPQPAQPAHETSPSLKLMMQQPHQHAGASVTTNVTMFQCTPADTHTDTHTDTDDMKYYTSFVPLCVHSVHSVHSVQHMIHNDSNTKSPSEHHESHGHTTSGTTAAVGAYHALSPSQVRQAMNDMSAGNHDCTVVTECKSNAQCQSTSSSSSSSLSMSSSSSSSFTHSHSHKRTTINECTIDSQLPQINESPGDAFILN